MKDNEDTTYQNLSDASKSVIRGKFNYKSYKEKSQIDSQTYHLVTLKK